MKTFWILMCLFGSLLGGAARSTTDCEKLGCKATVVQITPTGGGVCTTFWSNVVLKDGSCKCTESGTCLPSPDSSRQQCSIVGTAGTVNVGLAPACVCSNGVALDPGAIGTSRVTIVPGPTCKGGSASIVSKCYAVACVPAAPGGVAGCPQPPAQPVTTNWLIFQCTSCDYSCVLPDRD